MDTTVSTELVEQIEAPAQIIDDQGFITDERDLPIGHTKFPSDFEVLSEEAAQLFVAHLHTVDTKVAALEYERTIQIDRINAYYDRAVKRQQRRRQWLLWRFWPGVEAWARRQLAGTKERSISLLFGDLRIRTNPGRLAFRAGVETKYTRQALAARETPDLLCWAWAACPEAVKVTEEVQISKVPKTGDLPDRYFERTEDTEVFSIDTGVAKATVSDVIEPQGEELVQE